MRIFLLIAILMTCISCAQSTLKNESDVSVPQTKTEMEAPIPAVVRTEKSEIVTQKIPLFLVRKELTNSRAKLEAVVKVSECILRNDSFLKELGQKKFTSTKLTGAQVESKIRAAIEKGIQAKVSVYKSRGLCAWAQANAYTSGSEIYFNTCMQPWLAETGVHEYMHIDGLNFVHSSAKDWHSVAYQAGIIASKYVEACK